MILSDDNPLRRLVMEPMPPRSYAKGKKVTVSIRLPKQLRDVLSKVARERGHSFSNFVQDGLDQWAKAHEADEEPYI